MMQMLKPTLEQTNMNKVQTQLKSSTSFDQIFNQAKKQPKQEVATGSNEKAEVEKVIDIVNTTDTKEVLQKLGIEVDESGQFAVIDDEAVPLDEMMNLEDISAALGMSLQQLQQLVQQFTETPVESVEDLLSVMNELMPQLALALQGEHEIAPKDAKKLLEVLKLVETLSTKTDLTYTQVTKLSELKAALQQVVTQIVQVTNQTQQVTQTTTFTQTLASESDTIQAPIVQQSVNETKVVTVTLPTEKAAQSEALLKEMQQIINRSQLSSSNGQLKLMLKLFPENLGQVRIEIVQKDGVMTARLMASTALGKELLDSNLHQLKGALVAQNIQLDRLDITQSLQDAERSKDQHFFNNFFRQQQEQENEEDENEEESISFSDLLEEEVHNE